MDALNHIKAANGYDFHKQLALYAFTAYLDYGIGVVAIQQKLYRQNADGSVEADLQYIPYEPNVGFVPPEIEGLLSTYNPRASFLLSIEDDSGSAHVVEMTGEKLGYTPEGVYREAMAKAGKIALVEGQVVQLRDQNAGVPPGWYVFQKQEGAWLVLAKAAVDEDEGDIAATEAVVRLHVDFAELLQATDINVKDEEP